MNPEERLRLALRHLRSRRAGRWPTKTRDGAILTLIAETRLPVERILRLQVADVRSLRVSHIAWSWLSRWLEHRTTLSGPYGRLFVTCAGGPVRSNSVRRSLQRLSRQLGVPVSCSLLLRRGESVARSA